MPDATVRTLPDPVAALVEGLVGRPVRTVPLGGMSGADVHRATGPHGTVVAKGGVSARELAVYRQLRPSLVAVGVRIPVSHGAVEDAGRRWLVLEDVPTPLPRDRWLADPGVMATLGRLHGMPRSTIETLPGRFRPAWTEAMDQAAREWLVGESNLMGQLAALRSEAAPLFSPLGPISGDPNPLNWGVAANGELVLMDWERIGLGHPALDVAITIPGLPAAADFDLVAQAYPRSAGPGAGRASLVGAGTRSDPGPGIPGHGHSGDSGRFAASGPVPSISATVDARQLALAKVWTVVEFLAGSARTVDPLATEPVRRRRELADALARAVPGWLRSIG